MPEPLPHIPASPETISAPKTRRRPHGVNVVPAHGLRVGRPDVHIDTPSHTPGTTKGEQVVLKSPEKGRTTKARTARSSTSINPSLQGPIDARMPHLPPA